MSAESASRSGLSRELPLFQFFLVIDQRIFESTVWAHMDQPPFVLAGQRVLIAAAQVTNAVGVFQVVEFFRVLLVLAEVKFDGALILFAAIDESLFADTLRLHRGLRQKDGDLDGDRGAGKQQCEKHETALAFTPIAGCWGSLRHGMLQAHRNTLVFYRHAGFSFPEEAVSVRP